jgi:hypothetical protein
VDIHADQQARTITFFDSAGNVRVTLLTGPLFVTITNADTGKSITANISGPGKFDTSGNLTGNGPWLQIFPVADATTAPFLLLVTGHMHLDSAGHLLDYSGRATDVCGLLA